MDENKEHSQHNASAQTEHAGMDHSMHRFAVPLFPFTEWISFVSRSSPSYKDKL